MPDEITELKKHIKDQNELLQEIYKNSSRTKKYIFWGRVMSFVYLILFLASIILVVIYLPSFINNNLKPYQELLQDSGLKNINIDDLLKSYK